MITTAFVMAALTAAGFAVLFYKLPMWLRKFLSKRYILMDILLCALVFWALSFTLIGIMAAGFISLFVSVYLLWYKRSYCNESAKKVEKYKCKPHIYWAARCYNWWTKGKVDEQKTTVITTST